MASLPKKKKNKHLISICIRLCDSFKRTPQNFICPFIRAEESVRAFYRLKQESLKNILCDAGRAVDLQFISITWYPGKRESSTMDGNIFIEYNSSKELWNEDTFTKYKDFVTLKLQNLNIKYILVDQVMEKSTLSQPVITEIDYKIHELDSKFQNFLCQYQNSTEPDTIPDDLEDIKLLLQDLKGRRIQIAVLSHNAIGKSFLLNLLLLLTAESNQKSGGETMKMPKDIKGNATVKMVKEGQFEELPEAIKDFLGEITDDEQDFKKLVKPICHQLLFTDQEELERNESSFKSLSGYYTDHMRIDLEPYLLPQKDIFGDYNATTNCVFYLRYGTSFQAKVEYFNEKELQNQLYELVSLEQGSTERRPAFVNERMQEKAEQSLKARFNILTKNAPDNHNEKTLQDVLRSIYSPEEVELCDQMKEFAGKTELYIGNGKNPAADRLALQKLLKDFTLIANDDDDNDEEDRSRIMKQKVASLKRLIVYVPSTLLYGGTEILEMPGTNDSDPLAMSFIQDALDEVETVLLLSEFGFRLAGQEVRDCLTNSRFITHWKRDFHEYKLMFASYPEKNLIYQFGAGDREKLEKIMMDNTRKQEEEFESFNTLLHPVQLTPEMKQNIFSSTLLPVLHSSILSLEGDPLDILENNKDFLKNSGIDLLIQEFDRIIIQRKNVTILEIEKRLEDFEACQKGEANDKPDDDLSLAADDSQLATDTIDFDLERKILMKHENCFNKMKENIEELIKDAVDEKLKEILEKLALNAVKKWNEIKSKINGTAFFNPQHSGRHPAYKVKLDKILLQDSEKEVSLVLKDLIKNLEYVVEDYKVKAITLFTKDLRNMRKKAEKNMENALTGFLGMTRTSFNESTLMKFFENLFKKYLKTHLLNPAYRGTIENLRNMMETYIHKVFSELQRSFSQETFSLYNERWPSNLAKVLVRLCVPLHLIQSPQPGCTFCGSLKCSLCTYIESTTTFTNSKENKVYTISGNYNCTTKSVIYLITCKQCKLQYVGQTSLMMRRRFVDHLSRIKCKKGHLLAEHFNLDGHSDIALVIIEEVKNGDNLVKREKYWIRKLGTLKPKGLNAQL
ncbi:uncharacterized protein ACMZJ9_017560 [Mantella aurantiaca]